MDHSTKILIYIIATGAFLAVIAMILMDAIRDILAPFSNSIDISQIDLPADYGNVVIILFAIYIPLSIINRLTFGSKMNKVAQDLGLTYHNNNGTFTGLYWGKQVVIDLKTDKKLPEAIGPAIYVNDNFKDTFKVTAILPLGRFLNPPTSNTGIEAFDKNYNIEPADYFLTPTIAQAISSLHKKVYVSVSTETFSMRVIDRIKLKDFKILLDAAVGLAESIE